MPVRPSSVWRIVDVDTYVSASKQSIRHELPHSSSASREAKWIFGRIASMYIRRSEVKFSKILVDWFHATLLYCKYAMLLQLGVFN